MPDDIKAEFTQLCGKYFEEIISLDEGQRLAQLLESSEERRNLFVDIAWVHTNTGKVFQELVDTGEISLMDCAPQSSQVVTHKKSRFRSWFLAAASLIFVFALSYLINPFPTSPELLLVRIKGTDGVSIVRSHGQRVAGAVGSTIYRGDTVITSADARVFARYSDGTEITLYRKGEICFEKKENGGKTLTLLCGKLRADVAKQPKGLALEIATSTSVTTVMGTIFDLEANNESSTLTVEKGLVEFQRIRDGKKIRVSEGEFIASNYDVFEPIKYSSFKRKSLETNLLAYWGLEETSGIVIRDSSGNGYDLVNRGDIALQSTQGRIGKGFIFDGKRNQAMHPTFLDKMPLEISVSCWIKPQAKENGLPATFIHKTNEIINNQFFATVRMDHGGFPKDFVFSTRKNGLELRQLYSKTRWTEDIWYHYVFTWGPKGIKLYINGEMKAQNTRVTPLADGREDEFYIGSAGQSLQFFKGTLDEIRIYKKCLTDEDIQYLYNKR